MDYKKSSKSKLFSEFPPVTTEQWEEKIKIDLKGADYDRKLVWKTNEGFNVKPYYRGNDLNNLSYLVDENPGDFPFVRGNKTKNNSWFIRQNILVKNFTDANAKALNIISKGITSLGFIINDDNDICKNNIEILLKDIDISSVEINFKVEKNYFEIFEILKSIIKSKNIEPSKITGSIDFDPLGELSLKGNFCESEDSAFEYCKKLIASSSDLPNFKVIGVNANIFNNSGASIVEELGFGLSMGNEYLSRLTDLGLSVDEIAPKMKFNFAVGSNYFMEIAKLRAARLLWANIVKAYNPENISSAQMHIFSSTSKWNKTIYDAYVNILRTTTETMSCVIGGTDSLLVNSFNVTFEEPTEFSERIARNQQIILKEESNFDKVVDPAAGSYYIENLTDSIADQAWKIFIDVQEQNGYIEAFKKSFIQNIVKETANKRDLAIAKRKENFLGVNQFPNFNEHIEKDINPAYLEPQDNTLENAIAEPLKPYRGTQAFEILRLKTDKYSLNNKRPKAYMLPMGNLAMRKARAQFACNFFACAGFDVVDNNGFNTVDEAVNTFNKNNADIAVICSSDDEYINIAPEIYKKLKDKAIVVIAGYPKNDIEELKALGINNFISVKSNVLESLKDYQKKLNII